MNSATLSLLNEEEQNLILCHQLGHIMSGHVTYSTIAVILINFGLNNLPFMAGVAILPFQLALLEWYRKRELSSDRAVFFFFKDPAPPKFSPLPLPGALPT